MPAAATQALLALREPTLFNPGPAATPHVVHWQTKAQAEAGVYRPASTSSFLFATAMRDFRRAPVFA